MSGTVPVSCSHLTLLKVRSFFQPVGKIQKLRDEAYKVSVQTRRKINALLHGKKSEL